MKNFEKKNCSVVVVSGRTSLQQNLVNKPVGHEGTFSQTFLVNHVEQFSVTAFCGSFWKYRRESSTRWRRLVVLRTWNLSYNSHEENRREFQFQTDRNYYADLRQTYLVLKKKFVRGRYYETYKVKEYGKEQIEEAKKMRKLGWRDKLQFLSLLL